MDLKIENSKDIIREAIERYDKLIVACSFGKDSIVLVHLCIEIKPDIPIFTVMTPFKPKETLELKDEVIKLWDLNIIEYWSKDEVANDLWKTDPDECCRILKVEPTKEALADYDCWISGLRNTEGRTRARDFAIPREELV
jgi:phosphoadenosine phosphosulfate reductase